MVSPAIRSALAVAKRRNIVWGDWLAPALILVTPFVNFLDYQNYGLLQPESILAIAILAGVGLAASLVVTLWPELPLPFLPWPLLLRPLMFTTAMFYFLNVQPGLKIMTVGLMSGIFSDGAECARCEIAFFALVFVFFYAISTVLRKNAGTVYATVFGVLLLAIVAVPRAPDARKQITQTDFPAVGATRADLPPVVHIVLDEQIGIAGLPEDVPGVAALRRELMDFYRDNGFRLYGGAFSRYRHTENSIANLLNGAASPDDLSFLSRASTERAGEGYVLTKNAWFDQLTAQGYRIRVYQTDHLNVCAGGRHRIGSCTKYPGNGIGVLQIFDSGITLKIGALFRYFGYNTFAVDLANGLSNYLLPLLQSGGGPSGPANFMDKPPGLGAPWTKRVAGRLIDDLRAAEPGTAYFAHLLLPHRGFVLDENCRLKPEMDSWILAQQRMDGRLSDSSRSANYVEYFKQVRCAHRLLGEMLEALSEAGVLEQATVIVLGDHGSRLSALDPITSNASLLTRADILDSYSVLYAIRSPGVEAGYDPGVRSINALFAEQAMGRPPGEDPATVFLTQEEKPAREAGVRLVEYPFPVFD